MCAPFWLIMCPLLSMGVPLLRVQIFISDCDDISAGIATGSSDVYCSEATYASVSLKALRIDLALILRGHSAAIDRDDIHQLRSFTAN